MELTIRDIARLANASVATVSRVLNDRPGVSDERREAIIELAAKVGYVPNQSAQNLAKQRSHVLGFVASDLHNPVYADTVQIIEGGCRSRGYQVLIADSKGDPAQEKVNIDLMLRYRAEGLLVFPLADLEEDADINHFLHLKLRKVPFVLIGNVEGYSFDCVTLDEEDSGYLLADHLLELGHNRLAVVGAPPGNRNARKRREGVARAMTEHGVDTVFPFLRDAPEGAVTRHVVDTVTGWFREPDPPTALIAIHEEIVLRLWRPLHEMGLRIPRDLSLVCVGEGVWCPRIVPSITCVDVDNRLRAETALEILTKRMEDGDAPVFRECIPYQLIRRESSASPRA